MKKSSLRSTLAKLDGGTVQLTLHVPWTKIDLQKSNVIAELAKNVNVPGFRQGKAPLDKAMKHLDPDKIIENTINNLLPEAYTAALKEHSIVPAMYPKFELVSAKEGEDWQIRATTAELPKFEIKDYKETIKMEAKTKEKQTKEEKEQEVIRILLEKFDLEPPTMLIEDEVQARLANLLERLEKLGLELEGYLKSINKTPDTLREDYKAQARASIKLDLILGRISRDEKISVDDKEIQNFAHAADGHPNHKDHNHTITTEQKVLFTTILKRRKVLDALVSLL